MRKCCPPCLLAIDRAPGAATVHGDLTLALLRQRGLATLLSRMVCR
jgi:hypothetical protein